MIASGIRLHRLRGHQIIFGIPIGGITVLAEEYAGITECFSAVGPVDASDGLVLCRPVGRDAVLHFPAGLSDAGAGRSFSFSEAGLKPRDRDLSFANAVPLPWDR